MDVVGATIALRYQGIQATPFTQFGMSGTEGAQTAASRSALVSSTQPDLTYSAALQHQPTIQTLFAQFRARYPTGCLVSELLTIHEGNYVVRVLVQMGGTTLATGMASANDLELAEDRAKVRALEAMGITLSLHPAADPALHSSGYELQVHLMSNRSSGSDASAMQLPLMQSQQNLPSVAPPASIAAEHSMPVSNAAPVSDTSFSLPLELPSPVVSETVMPSAQPMPSPVYEQKVEPPYEEPVLEQDFLAQSIPAPNIPAQNVPIQKIPAQNLPEQVISEPDFLAQAVPEQTFASFSVEPDLEADLDLEPDELAVEELPYPANGHTVSRAKRSVGQPPLPESPAPARFKAEPEPNRPAEQPAERPAPRRTKTERPQASAAPTPRANAAPSPIIDLSDIIAQTTVELRRLGWSDAQGRTYLQRTYNRRSRQQLTDEELFDFLSYLESQPSPDQAPF